MIARLAVLLLLLAPLPVLAQSETGTRIGGRPAQVPGREAGSNAQRARVWLERFAACLARRDAKRVAEALDAPVGSDSPAFAKLSRGGYNDCLSGGGEADQLSVSDQLLRGALYAERVGHLVQRLTPAMIEGRPSVVSDSADGAASDPMRASLLRFGECVMRADPEHALEFVNAGAGTGAEDKALAALGPAFGGCVDAGSSIQLSRSTVETGVAEAIYRVTQLPAPIQTAGKK